MDHVLGMDTIFHILNILPGPRRSFDKPRTSLYRGSLNQVSTELTTRAKNKAIIIYFITMYYILNRSQFI